LTIKGLWTGKPHRRFSTRFEGRKERNWRHGRKWKTGVYKML